MALPFPFEAATPEPEGFGDLQNRCCKPHFSIGHEIDRRTGLAVFRAFVPQADEPHTIVLLIEV